MCEPLSTRAGTALCPTGASARFGLLAPAEFGVERSDEQRLQCDLVRGGADARLLEHGAGEAHGGLGHRFSIRWP